MFDHRWSMVSLGSLGADERRVRRGWLLFGLWFVRRGCPFGLVLALVGTMLGCGRKKATDGNRRAKTWDHTSVVVGPAGSPHGRRTHRSRGQAPHWTVAPTQARGWAPTGFHVARVPKMYDSANLFELLDGGADEYIQAGMERLAFVVISPKGKQGCRVSLFKMKDAGSAGRLLKAERDPGMKKLSLGEVAWGDKEGLMFRKGTIFVRVEADGPKAVCPFESVARRVEADRALPWK